MQTTPKGIYLKEPHGRLIADGEKTIIAHAVGTLDIVGERVLCTKEDGEGKALGILTVGDPTEITAQDFDKISDEHLVSRKERLQWWPLRERLWLYPVEAFEPFKETKCVDVDGVPIDMGDVNYVEPRVQQMDLCSKSTSGEKGESEMPWKVFKEGEKFCVYKLDADGNKTGKSLGCHDSEPKAKAQQRALYASEGEGKQYTEDEKMYGVPYGVTSFAQLAAAEEAYEAAEMATKRAYQLQRMVSNIFSDPNVEDKAKALEALAKEYAKVCKKPTKEFVFVDVKEADVILDEKIVFCVGCGREFPLQDGVDEKELDGKECPTCGDALKAKWDTATINNLPDSSFLYVEPGGEKDGQGKTTPRSKRHLPYKDASGKVDAPHLRNAISRLSQSGTGKGWMSESLRKKLLTKARSILKNQGGKEFSISVKMEQVAQRLADGLLNFFKERVGERKASVDLLDFEAVHDHLVETGSKSCAYAVKAQDGKVYWMQWTTNAFRDREGETFTTKSIEELVERRAGDTKKGEFWFWHIPGTKFADVTWQGVVGRFLVEAGPFDDTKLGRAAQKFFTENPDGHSEIAPSGWGASHGYKYESEDREDAVYEWFDIRESTVLPEHLAANQYNPAPGVVLLEEKMLTQEQRKAVDTIFGEGSADEIEGIGESKTKALEAAGIAFKENEAEAEVQPEPEPAEDVAPEAEAEVEAEAEAEPEPEQEAVQEEGEAEAEAEPEAEDEAEAEVETEAEAQGKEFTDVKEALVALAAVVGDLRKDVQELKAVPEQVQALADKVQDIQRSDDEKVTERLAGIPGASFKALIEEMVEGRSTIGAQENQIDGRGELARSKAKLPKEMADKQQDDAVFPVPMQWLGRATE